MTELTLAQHKQRIDALFLKVKDLPADAEIQSHWARYLCVLVCGFVEVALATIYGGYAQKRSHAHVASYVGKKLARSSNQNAARVVQLAHSFSNQWGHDLQAYIEGKRKDALDSIVNNRNQIAHGRSVDITINRLREYYRSVVEVVEWVESTCA